MCDWNDVGAETGRFTLGEDGQIFWQINKTNPMPGDLIAVIEKGDARLEPKVTVSSAEAPQDAQDKIVAWLHSHIKEVLAPLFTMIDQEAEENRLQGCAFTIGQKLFDAMGVIHRSDLEGDIPQLTPEHRTALRRKRVKLGPILVFMPELVKPAAVNMRALLHGLWNDKILPMGRPADGRVSVSVDPENVDRNYFRSIGYPIFGAKAIRIDMLDRVITDIYDSSKDFQFRAKHRYMEWLGCGEDDLYAILQSMGFRKQKPEDAAVIGDKIKADIEPSTEPLNTGAAVIDDVKEEKSVSTIEIEIEGKEQAGECAVTTENLSTDADKSQNEKATSPEIDKTKKAQDDKPLLALFWLKKGKISDRPQSKRPQADHKRPDKKSFGQDKKPFKGKKNKGGDNKGRDNRAKNYSAKPKEGEVDNDSPFAILQQLKK